MLVARAYWEESRSHRYSLVFALPLLLLYELLEALAPVRMGGGVVRNGADVILTGLFTAAFGPRGPMIFMALVIGGALVLIWRDRRAGPIRPYYFALMLAESDRAGDAVRRGGRPRHGAAARPPALARGGCARILGHAAGAAHPVARRGAVRGAAVSRRAGGADLQRVTAGRLLATHGRLRSR